MSMREKVVKKVLKNSCTNIISLPILTKHSLVTLFFIFYFMENNRRLTINKTPKHTHNKRLTKQPIKDSINKPTIRDKKINIELANNQLI